MRRWLLLMLLLAVMTVGSAQEDETQDVRFFLTFVPNIQFSPLYVAIEKGYAEGLNIQIEHGDENVGVDLIAAGEIPFGMISGEQVILARAGRRPVVYVYEWFQKFPVGIIVPDTTEGIESVNDLAGLRVGIPGRFGASYFGLTALLAANGMQESDIALEPIGFSAPDVVCAGRVDASVVYVNNEPLQIQQRADAAACGEIASVEVILVADYADMVSNGIMTNEDVIAENPELVTAMVAAFDSGLHDTLNNPAEAYLLSVDYVEGLPLDDSFQAALELAAAEQADFLESDPTREEISARHALLVENLKQAFPPEMTIQFEVLVETLALWDAEQLGVTTPESWVATQDILQSMELLPREIELEAAYTNDFLPQ
ncbi:MAG: ABC transporter substrate-binding protein [Anaerolineae bacterium]